MGRRRLVRTLTAALHARRLAVRSTGNEAEARSTSGSLKGLPPVLVEDARFTQAEAELRWLDLCEARLNGGGAA